MKHLLLTLLLAVPLAAMPTPVSQLPTRCTYNGCTSCSPISDVTSGVCRTIRWSTSAGEVKVQVCDKGDRYEIYRQSAPAALDFSACTGGGCVDKWWGFRAFTSTTLPDDTCTPDPPDPPPTQPLVEPNSIGFASETRAANHARLLNAWWGNANIIQLISNQSRAWVPWYSSSTECDLAHLHAGSCNPPGGVAADRNCMVSDEFSQVLLATAQGTSENESRMQKLVAMLQAIAGNYGSLPAWIVTRTGDTLIFTDRNSASDADARIVLALYIAAGSPHFSPTARASFRTLADQMAAHFLQYDFRHECRAGRNGVPICHWLAGGGAQAGSGLGSNNFGHAGYYGDAVIALLAAYRATGTQSYRDAAIDTVNSYLLAANFNGTSFSVPPFAFRFNLLYSPPRAECTEQCSDSAWDYFDASRAVSICKARYYAQLAGVPLPADLDVYCNAWMNAGGITSTAYEQRYRYNGTPWGSPRNKPHENGLGLSLDFPTGSRLATRLDTYGAYYQPSGQGIWRDEQCHGVYTHAFHTTNLGSAIGRDLHAFKP